jgi:hypothetical protein
MRRLRKKRLSAKVLQILKAGVAAKPSQMDNMPGCPEFIE